METKPKNGTSKMFQVAATRIGHPFVIFIIDSLASHALERISRLSANILGTESNASFLRLSTL